MTETRDDDTFLQRVVAAIALLACWNVVINVVIPSPLYLPANLAMAAVLLGTSDRWGLTRRDLGLERSTARSGLRLGTVAAGWAVVVLVGLVAWPTTREFFADDTVTDLAVVGLVYQVLIRIPFGTALFEELAFRGVLFGLWRRAASTRTAAIGSSAVFGAWHVLPTLARLDLNPAGEYAASGVAATGIVLGAVAATTIAGVGFVWLRVRSASLVAAIVMHAAINMTAFTLGWVIAR